MKHPSPVSVRKLIQVAVTAWLLWLGWQLILSLLSHAIPLTFKEGFTYRDIGIAFGLPHWVSVRANFDGYHYITIAKNGYGLYQHAFFPLYPLLIRSLSALGIHNLLLNGLLINLVASAMLCIVWSKIILQYLHKSMGELKWFFVYLFVFPTAFFLLSVYNEALFLLLFGLYVHALLARRTWRAFLWGVMLGLTRSVALFAPLIPLLLATQPEWRRNWRSLFRLYVPAITGPLLGVELYMAYLQTSIGDPFGFIHAQAGFHNGRSTFLVLLPQVLWRYIKIVTRASFDIAYIVAVIELVMFVGVTVLLAIPLISLMRGGFWTVMRERTGRVEAGLLLFSLANILFPTLSGTLSSIPRYGLVGVALFIWASSAIKKPGLRFAYLLLCALTQILLFVLYTHGYFVS